MTKTQEDQAGPGQARPALTRRVSWERASSQPAVQALKRFVRGCRRLVGLQSFYVAISCVWMSAAGWILDLIWPFTPHCSAGHAPWRTACRPSPPQSLSPFFLPGASLSPVRKGLIGTAGCLVKTADAAKRKQILSPYKLLHRTGVALSTFLTRLVAFVFFWEYLKLSSEVYTDSFV